MSDDIPTSCAERKELLPEQNTNGPSRNICPGRGTGKRFARRAKRWAELQQKRYNQRFLALRTGLFDSSEESICVYDHFVAPHAAVGLTNANKVPDYESRTENDCGQISCWISRPQPMEHPSFNASVLTRSASSTYESHSSISIRHVGSDSAEDQISSAYFSNSGGIKTMSWLSKELNDLLPTVTTELSVTPDSVQLLTPWERVTSADQFRFSSVLSSDELGLAKCLLNTAPPPEREWVMIRHADPDRPIATFTVLCYNVLCDKYATVNQYSYCPSWALNWEYRKMSIMKEIRNYEADIITLQEVETEQFRLLFQPELKVLGYTGIFSPKSRAKTMNEEDRKYVDGCAIFWKSEKFEMDREHLIEFTQVVVKKASTSEHMLNRVMPRDNIALCAVLRIKDNVYNNRRMTMAVTDNVVNSPLVVCTAHIHWDPELCDVKLVQTMMLAHELYKLLEEVAEQFRITPQQTPVLICGDLNSLPDSGVFEFLSRGKISRSHADLKGFRDDSCLERFSSGVRDPSSFTHSLRLDSAVELSNIPFTNYTLDFKGMIDYIFSTPQSLARLGFLGAFDSNWVAQNKIIGFPHPHVPSDHIPIMAQYAVIPTSHQRAPPPPHPLNNSYSSR